MLAANLSVTRDSPLFIGVNRSFQRAAEINDTKLIELFYGMGARDMDFGIAGAAQGGHLELTKYFENMGASKYIASLYSRIGGDRAIIKKYGDYYSIYHKLSMKELVDAIRDKNKELYGFVFYHKL